MTQVRMPTGEIVDMPDNPTPEQLASLARINGTSASPQQSNPASAGGTVPSLGRTLGLSARPVLEAAGGTVGMLGDALNSAINMGGQAIGHNPHLGMPSQAIARGIDAILPKPATTTEKVVNALASMGYGAMGADPLANAISARLPKPQPRSMTPREQALTDAQQAGYKLTPDQVPGTGIGGRLTEFVAGKKPLTQAAQLRNQSVTNKLAAKAAGVPADALTPETLANAASAAYERGYAPVAAAGRMTNGRLYNKALDKVLNDFQGASASFPSASKNEVAQLVNGYRVRSFDAGDAIDAIRNLRADATAAYKSGNTSLAKANNAVAQALEGSIEANLQARGQPAAQMLEAYRAARTQIAKTSEVARALKAGTGDVNALRLASVLQRNPDRLTDELKTVAQMAQNAPRLAAMPTEQAPVSTITRALSAGIPPAMAGYFLGPHAAVGAAALPFARAGMRGAMLSPAGQRMIAPSAMNPGSLEQFLTSPYARGLPAAFQQSGLFGPQQ